MFCRDLMFPYEMKLGEIWLWQRNGENNGKSVMAENDNDGVT